MSKILATRSHHALSKQSLLSQPVPPQVAACKLSLEGSQPSTILLHLQEVTSNGVVALDIGVTTLHRCSPAEMVWNSSSSKSGERLGGNMLAKSQCRAPQADMLCCLLNTELLLPEQLLQVRVNPLLNNFKVWLSPKRSAGWTSRQPGTSFDIMAITLLSGSHKDQDEPGLSSHWNAEHRYDRAGSHTGSMTTGGPPYSETSGTACLCLAC